MRKHHATPRMRHRCLPKSKFLADSYASYFTIAYIITPIIWSVSLTTVGEPIGCQPALIS